MTTYTNAAGVNPAMFNVWGPFYIISVFPIILHLSFGDKLSQNREIIWLSLFSLKVMWNFPFYLRKKFYITCRQFDKNCIIHFLYILHKGGFSSIFQIPLITKSVSYKYVSNSLWLFVFCCCCLSYISIFWLELWILNLLNT